ncbi:glycosyltransferase family 2 protein [Paenibacillus illinoisensis]|nr:glycosyltransferase [Paenibacillus illinoisensis]
MIVKDEERSLKRCLNSVKDVVDEIIIVDTGSKDKTKEIAREFTSNIYDFEWTNNFADARNYAIGQANCDYILSLDADEYFADESKYFLNEKLNASHYFLRIRNFVRTGIVDTHSFARLFKKNVGYKYQGAIHEQINFWDYPHLKGEQLLVNINHDGYTKEIVKSKNKNVRNMSIVEEELKQSPSAFGYFNLGTQFRVIGNHEKAIDAFQRSFSLNPNTTFTPKLIVLLIQSLSDLERYSEALKIGKDASLLYPEYTDIYYEVGVQYKKLHYWKDAEAVFLRCLELGEVDELLLSSLEGVGSYLSHAHLAEIYMHLGLRKQAQSHISKSLFLNKMHLATLRIYLEVFLGSSPEDLLSNLQTIYSFESLEETKLIMQALYFLRSTVFPLLLTKIDRDMSIELEAWIAQVQGDDSTAKKLWDSCDKISDDSRRNLLFTAIVTEDPLFFKQFEHEFNLRSKDKSLLMKIINRETINETDISQDVRNYFEDFCYDILMQRRYEVVEYLMTKVHVPILRLQLAEMLYKFQFNELALECVIEESENSVDKSQVYLLVGDILKSLKMYGDSYEFYLKATSRIKNFEVLYKIYDLAVLADDEKIQREYINQLNKLTPISEWARKVGIAN